MDIQVRSATDADQRRSRNEDRAGFWLPEEPEVRERRGVLLLVADGMGSARGGEAASRIAVERALASYREADGEPLEDLERAFLAANKAVHEEKVRSQLGGMGTGLAALVVRGYEAFVAHVGGSRAYLVREGSARRLTEDHSLVAELVKEGRITPEQARVDPRRHLLTRSVGGGSWVRTDMYRVEDPLCGGDTLLLSTDGLHGVVADEEIGAFASVGDLEGICEGLVWAARQRGGPDSIAVVAARLG